MKRKFFFLLLPTITILFISCNGKGQQSNRIEEGDTISNAVEQTDTTVVQLTQEEDFRRFIERFSNDSQFQLRRIKFPISVIVPDTGDEGMAPKEESIGKYDWEQLDLSYDSTYLTRPYDQYYQVVRFKNDTAVVEIRGINNGIYADYYFSRIDDEWYLITLYEASF
ncbi:MAG TPA: DUF4348 domain-containing protein [Proteiniphilum sp.]|nr:DUF4348 domain-containing protein [Proteiniphilum sp.]HPD87327.1 DUF4348 domain-containing protein [Proteiniphilum sp.]HPJ50238.1 DUF4348 domain-containing protein [Proteiniphilum sp.]HPR20770.1 DUF4348 domain-containing protein [Proteiniphilum sp.]